MAQVIIGRDGPLTYYNYGGETWGDVCGIGLKDQRKPDFDYDYVFIHKGTIKPFAARYEHKDIKRRWYKVKDDLPAPVNDHLGRPTYVLNNDNIDKNTYIRFYYVNDEEKYIEIEEPNNPFVCNTMQSMNLQKKPLYYTETFCRDPDSTQCSVQGGKNKHKSYHKRQQRRSKRRQQKSKRIQRK